MMSSSESDMVCGYLRQQQQKLFKDQSTYFNLHSVNVIILLYSSGIITLIIKPSFDEPDGFFQSFKWTVYPTSTIQNLKNGIISRIPANVRDIYVQKPLFYSNNKLDLRSTVLDYNIEHLSTLEWREKNKVVVKVGMLGDSQTGKTELMVTYIADKYDENYIQTLGVNFMDKTIELKNVYVKISLWDLGGQREFKTLMPLVCSDSKVMLFVFDLTQKQSLFSIKRWYKEARKENKIFMPFLVGTKYHLYDELEDHHKQDITKQARKFAKKMHAPLIYCSSEMSINVKKIFKVIIAKVFDLKPKIREAHDCLREALIEFDIGGSDVNEDEEKDETENYKSKKYKKDIKKKKNIKKKYKKNKYTDSDSKED